jgi:hypothetical protein
MALTYNAAALKIQAFGVGAAITSNTLSCSTGDYITVEVYVADSINVTALTISNNGSAITWTLRASVGTAASDCPIWLYDGIAGATPPTTVTATATAGNNLTTNKGISVRAHQGAHATTPMPAGNIFTAENQSSISRSITPTASGSCLWMACGDWDAGNTFVEGANTSFEGAAVHEAGQATYALFRPTTQPRGDASAFTLAETHTGSAVTYIAYEVQAAAASNPTLSSPTPSGIIATATDATIGATTDVASGTAYCVLDSTSLAGVTNAQVLAGNDASNNPTDFDFSASVGSTTISIPATGLTAETLYYYAVAQSGDSNVVTGSFTTGAATGPTDITGKGRFPFLSAWLSR